MCIRDRDFTLAELKTLRARERLPELRKANARYDGEFSIPTFEEVLDLVAAADAQRAAKARAAGLPPPPRVGVYPETKHPSHFASLGLHFDERMLDALNRHGYSKRNDPICLQSFEVANLKTLRRRTNLPLVQLVAPTGQPFDFTLAGDKRTYLDRMKDAGLARRARAAGLGIHVWTLRAENEFLPPELRSSGDATAHGDLNAEIRALLDAGITGFFSDQPDLAVRARDEWWAR